MKKYILIIAVALGLLPAYGESFRVDGIDYVVSRDDARSCFIGPSTEEPYAGDFEIPTEVIHFSITYKVTGIYDYAFAGCSELTSVEIPDEIKEIGRNAFQGCTSITNMTFPGHIDKIAEQTFYGCSSLETFSGEGIVYIGEAAFSNCAVLNNITFSEQLEYVGESGFRNCFSLEEAPLYPDTEVGSGAFSGCTSLISIYWPASMNIIPESVFSDCISLKAVDGLSDVEEIGDYAFSNCSSLEEFSTSVNLKRIGKYAFAFCESLNMREIIGEELVIDDFSFTGCTSLEILQLIGVTNIGVEAFANNTALVYINLGKDIQRISDRAFRNCGSLEIVRCGSLQPPFVENHSFDNVTYAESTLEVPEEALLLYRQTPAWNNFGNIVGFSPFEHDGVEDILLRDFLVTCSADRLNISGPAGKVNIYGAGGLILYSGIKGNEDLEIDLPATGILIVGLNHKYKRIWKRK